MEITTTFDPRTRRAWRAWLEANHARETEIWLLLRRGESNAITYLDAVEEALCFGWIDGIAKRQGEATAQRFTPRRLRSNWTELNRERGRNPGEWERRLAHFVRKTAKNEMFGNWDDSGLPRTGD